MEQWDGEERRIETKQHFQMLHEAIDTLNRTVGNVVSDIAWGKCLSKWILGTSGAILAVVVGILVPIITDIHHNYDTISNKVDRLELAVLDTKRVQDAWKIRIGQDHRTCHDWRMSP